MTSVIVYDRQKLMEFIRVRTDYSKLEPQEMSALEYLGGPSDGDRGDSLSVSSMILNDNDDHDACIETRVRSSLVHLCR